MWDFKKYSDNIALQDEFGKSLTYAELDKTTTSFIEAIGKRTLVFCLCENKIGSVIGYAACITGKIVPLLLNANMERNLLNRLIEAYRPEYIWIPMEQVQEFKEYESVYSLDDYTLLKTNCKIDYGMLSELALLLTTSGSTGSPKLVRQSYNNILANTNSIVSYLHIDSSERAITTLPMNYTYGLSIINTHLMVGATILLTDKSLMQKEFWNFLRSENATSFGGVPYTYEMLDRIRFYRMDLPALRYMTQAGGKITPELHKKFAEYAEQNNKRFIVMYGQCEATARMGYLPAEKALEKCGSMGIVVPGGQFHLIDENGEEISKAGVCGELVYEGENVTLGYAESCVDLSKGDERNGVLHTGDLAKVDEDGFYYIVGRKKRFLKIYGNRVNLDEIDRLIKTEFANIDCASSGVDDKMYIFITDDTKVDDIKKYIVEKTKLNPAAFKIIVIENIPKNDAGKVLYKELEKYYKK